MNTTNTVTSNSNKKRKLTKLQRRQLKGAISSGNYIPGDLAKQFGVSKSTIGYYQTQIKKKRRKASAFYRAKKNKNSTPIKSEANVMQNFVSAVTALRKAGHNANNIRTLVDTIFMVTEAQKQSA